MALGRRTLWGRTLDLCSAATLGAGLGVRSTLADDGMTRGGPVADSFRRSAVVRQPVVRGGWVRRYGAVRVAFHGALPSRRHQLRKRDADAVRQDFDVRTAIAIGEDADRQLSVV